MARKIETVYELPPISLDEEVGFKEYLLEANSRLSSQFYKQISESKIFFRKTFSNLEVPKASFAYAENKFSLKPDKEDLITVRKDIFSNGLNHDINNDNIYYIKVFDDYMSPKLELNSVCYFNYDSTFDCSKLKSGSIYVIGMMGTTVIARLFIELDNSLTIKIDNESRKNIFPDKNIPVSLFLETVTVFGQVIGVTTLSSNFM